MVGQPVAPAHTHQRLYRLLSASASAAMLGSNQPIANVSRRPVNCRPHREQVPLAAAVGTTAASGLQEQLTVPISMPSTATPGQRALVRR
jgi:hypothetical protein